MTRIHNANADEGIGEVVRNFDNSYTLPWTEWRGFECEVKLNTPNVSDGLIQRWTYDTDETVLRNQTWSGLNLRGDADPLDYLELIQFGNQADRTAVGIAVDEFR